MAKRVLGRRCLCPPMAVTNCFRRRNQSIEGRRRSFESESSERSTDFVPVAASWCDSMWQDNHSGNCARCPVGDCFVGSARIPK